METTIPYFQFCDRAIIHSENGEAVIRMRHNITHTGKHYLVVAMCDAATANFNLSGKSVVLNPYGHLPGRVYGFLPFVRVLLGGYAMLLTWWVFRCARYHRELMGIQYMISAVILLFLVDMYLKYLCLHGYNDYGVRNQFLSFISIVSSTLSRSIGRGVMLIVSMG